MSFPERERHAEDGTGVPSSEVGKTAAFRSKDRNDMPRTGQRSHPRINYRQKVENKE